jgi:Holliday junction resolvase
MAVKGETRVVKKIKEGLQKIYPNCFFFKVHGSGYQKSGIPDLIGCINGLFIGIEVKDPKNKSYGATELQLHIIELIKGAGGIAGVATSLEEAKELIENGFIQTSKSSTKKTKGKKEVCIVHGTGDRKNLGNNKKDRKAGKVKKDK